MMNGVAVNSKSPWQSEELCRRLSHLFGRHSLGLSLGWIDKGEPRLKMASGFLLVYEGYWFWITAGHVIEEIEKFQKSAKELHVRAHWIDGYKVSSANSIPVADFPDMATWSIYKAGLDLGMVLIHPFDAKAMSANPDLIPLDETIWKGRDNQRPDSYYIVGSPEDWQPNSVIQSGRNVGVYADFPTVVIPVDRVDAPGDSEDAFWTAPGAFHGRIAATISNGGESLTDIKGVSGGPIFGLQRRTDGEMRYWLYGIQGSWKKGECVIRATDVAVLERALALLLEETEASRENSSAKST